ncbi:MAG: aldo/keto reductase [Flavisolibacter sp.]
MNNRKIDWKTLNIPKVVFGTSGLGNLFVTLEEETKCNLIKEYLNLSKGVPFFDCAGKYGAGLALESLGACLKKLKVKPSAVLISNKLGWLRTPLKTTEPTFEPGVWKDLKFDAIQKISYGGILECFEQGNELLQGYFPQLVSVHDPDEYLSTAKDQKQADHLYEDILNAYKALYELKEKGKVLAIGVGAKDWKTIRRLSKDVPFDWVMIANSMTIKSHPEELLNFMHELESKNVFIINSAVFHSGFLIGGDHLDYKLIRPDSQHAKALFQWRDRFFELCREFKIKPAEACVQFALHAPGVKAIALSTSLPTRMKENLDMVNLELPKEFWIALKSKGLVSENFLTHGTIKE